MFRRNIYTLKCIYYVMKLTFHDFWNFSSVTQLCPTLCNPMDCSTPSFPVHHQLLELAQTHVHLVGDAIQPSHPLLSPSPAFSLSQHQSLSSESVFTSGGQSILKLRLLYSNYPLQHSGLQNSMDCIVHGVAKSQTWLSDFHFHKILQQCLIWGWP